MKLLATAIRKSVKTGSQTNKSKANFQQLSERKIQRRKNQLNVKSNFKKIMTKKQKT